MLEIFPSKGDFRFSSDAIDCVTNVQSLRHGASCFLVTLIGYDRSTQQQLEKCPHSNLHSLARYIGTATRILFESLMESCSLFLETAMTELISNSTFRDTVQDNTTTEDEEDGVDPLVERAFDDIPALADSLAEYEEHFLYQLLMSTGDAAMFSPHWFDAVLQHYALHNASIDHHGCACALHAVTVDSPSAANSIDSNIHTTNLSKIASVSSSSDSSGTSFSCSAEWEADILLFAVAQSQVGSQTQVQDGQCHVLLRLLHDAAEGSNNSGITRSSSGNSICTDNSSPQSLLVMSALHSACSSTTLILSARFPLHAVGVLIEEFEVDGKVTGVDATHITVISSNAGSSLVQITADVLQQDFQQAWTAALQTVAVALFCHSLPQDSTSSIHAYQAALAATFTPSTTGTATIVHTQHTHHADNKQHTNHDNTDDEVKCAAPTATADADPVDKEQLPPDSVDCIEYIPQPPITAQPSARMESSNSRPSSASLRPGRTLKTSEYQPM